MNESSKNEPGKKREVEDTGPVDSDDIVTFISPVSAHLMNSLDHIRIIFNHVLSPQFIINCSSIFPIESLSLLGQSKLICIDLTDLMWPNL